MILIVYKKRFILSESVYIRVTLREPIVMLLNIQLINIKMRFRRAQ